MAGKKKHLQLTASEAQTVFAALAGYINVEVNCAGGVSQKFKDVYEKVQEYLHG